MNDFIILTFLDTTNNFFLTLGIIGQKNLNRLYVLLPTIKTSTPKKLKLISIQGHIKKNTKKILT